jgi:hypothetical protein
VFRRSLRVEPASQRARLLIQALRFSAPAGVPPDPIHATFVRKGFPDWENYQVATGQSIRLSLLRTTMLPWLR